MNATELQREIDGLFSEMIDLQERKVLEIARSIEPSLTRDDLWNSYNHPKLEADTYFQYEDGHLAGLMAARVAVAAALKSRSTAPAPPRAPRPDSSRA
jgi:hypothetical protein